MSIGAAQPVLHTRPEIAVRRELHSRGLRYLVGRQPVKGIRRNADILFPRQKVAVFVDGCYWHACPKHCVIPRTNTEFWVAKFENNRERDKATARLLRPHGWRTLRFWEHEDVTKVADRIQSVVQG